jgi:hypothetical protein
MDFLKWRKAAMLESLYIPTWKCRDLTANEIAQIGVPEKALAGDEAKGTFKVSAAPVIWGIGCDGGTFMFGQKEDGSEPVMAVMFVCRDEVGNVADMAAWSPRDSCIGTWQGRVSMLGEENCLKPRLGEPLAVFASPREWLKADREGVVIIDALAALPKLYAASPICVASKQMRAQLLEQWRPKIPEIRCS